MTEHEIFMDSLRGLIRELSIRLSDVPTWFNTPVAMTVVVRFPEVKVEDTNHNVVRSLAVVMSDDDNKDALIEAIRGEGKTDVRAYDA